MDALKLENLEITFIEQSAELETARRVLYEAAEDVVSAELALENKKVGIYSAGGLTATNDAARKLQLGEMTVLESGKLADAQQRERRARFEFDHAQAEYDLLRYRLRIAEIAAKSE